MNDKEKLTLMQNIYAVSVAESVNTYEKLGALDMIVKNKKERQSQSAPIMIQQLSIDSIQDIFNKLREVFGCANWTVEKATDGYVAKASHCKLCALAKKMGGANPCRGWCIDPIIGMIKSISNDEVTDENILVESTLYSDDSCILKINAK